MRVLLGSLVLVACGGKNAAPADTAAPSGPVDTDTPVDTGDPPGPEPAWYSVDGILRLEDGAPTEGSTLDVGIWGRDPHGIAVQTCMDRFDASAALPGVPPLDDVTPYGAWFIELTDGTCPGRPAVVGVGIGPLLPELWPAAESMGVSVRHTRGLYLTSGDELVVFGLAATADQAAGAGAPDSLYPLPDGRYHLRGVWLLPLTP